MDFNELAASRRAWIDDVLIPWCRTASRAELRKAEADWTNIAGNVAPEKTLWAFAWSRFDGLIHEQFGGLDESREWRVLLRDGATFSGYPDARRSLQGEMILITSDGDAGPFAIDNIAAVEPLF